jgi:translation initiation factor 4E
MLGSFETVEDFWRHYIHIKRPSQLDVLHNLYLFREDLKPMWETFPDGGCWILKVKKSSGVTSKLWQDLVFACVGELFEEPTVAGIVLAVRAKDDIISIWNSSNSKNVEMRFLIAEKLKKILNLDMNTIIEYKSHRESISDGSSFRNAEAYVLTDDK